jgi:hypothetical protein
VVAKGGVAQASFGIAIMGRETGNEQLYSKKLENQQTPFTLELPDGEYMVVVHNTSKNPVVSKMARKTNGNSNERAQGEGEIAVLQSFTTGISASGL